MDAKHFASLFESVTQMDEIGHRERQPSREFHIDAIGVTDIRKATGLSQAKFATLIDVQVDTLHNWKQGRPEPTGRPKRYCASSVRTRKVSSRLWLANDEMGYGGDLDRSSLDAPSGTG